MCNLDHSYAFLACNHTAWLCTQTVCSYTLFSKVTLSALHLSCSLCGPNLYTTLHLPQSTHYHALPSSPLNFGLPRPVATCRLPSRLFSSGAGGPHQMVACPPHTVSCPKSCFWCPEARGYVGCSGVVLLCCWSAGVEMWMLAKWGFTESMKNGHVITVCWYVKYLHCAC